MRFTMIADPDKRTLFQGDSNSSAKRWARSSPDKPPIKLMTQNSFQEGRGSKHREDADQHNDEFSG